MDGFFSQLPYKYHLEKVAFAGDYLKICPQLDSRVTIEPKSPEAELDGVQGYQEPLVQGYLARKK